MNRMDDLHHIGVKAREEIAGKVGRILARETGAAEREAAIELAQLLVEDVAVSVREALSRELKGCTFLPKEIVKKVSLDIEQVSVPFIVASQAVDDEFLEEIVRNCGDVPQEAVAKRDGISEAVSFAIADVACQHAVETLVNNETADLALRSHKRVIERFPEERSLLEKLTQRGDLAPEVAESLIFKVSQEFGRYMAKRFELSNDYSSYLVSLASRQVFSRTLERGRQPEIENYLSQLKSAGGLSSDLLLHYLQNGNVRLFTSSIAVLLDKPFVLIEERINAGDKKMLAKLLEASGFTRPVVGVLLIAYERLLRG